MSRRRYATAALSLAARAERARQRRGLPVNPVLIRARRGTIANKGCKADLGTTCEMYGLYQDGKTLAEVADIFGIKRQGVWGRFKRCGLKMRSELMPANRALPSIEFNGAKYAPYNTDNYFRKTSGDRSLLHWDMWIAARGPIKRNHEIRFVDGDRLNIVLENLVCVRVGEGRGFGKASAPLKPCLNCGRKMLPQFGRKNPESPSAYARRKTCDTACSAMWKKGKPKGTRMP